MEIHYDKYLEWIYIYYNFNKKFCFFYFFFSWDMFQHGRAWVIREKTSLRGSE